MATRVLLFRFKFKLTLNDTKNKIFIKLKKKKDFQLTLSTLRDNKISFVHE